MSEVRTQKTNLESLSSMGGEEHTSFCLSLREAALSKKMFSELQRSLGTSFSRHSVLRHRFFGDSQLPHGWLASCLLGGRLLPPRRRPALATPPSPSSELVWVVLVLLLQTTLGASISIHTILWLPYYAYSIMGPKTLFQLLRPLY